MKITLKAWKYREAQDKAQHYNFTLVWDEAKQYIGDPELLKAVRENPTEEIIEEFLDDKNFEEAYNLYGTVARETEKALLLECDYWNLNRAGRYVTDAPRCKGFKVWVPKVAIYKINGKPLNEICFAEMEI